MNETILLIEDDEALAQLVQLLLERAGYAVQVANNGESGLGQARQTPPSLVSAGHSHARYGRLARL